MDHRDAAAHGRGDGLREDWERMLLVDTFNVDCHPTERDAVPAEVPARTEVCYTCEGRGKHVNPSIDAHGLSPDDFAEDPDFADQYFGGAFDVSCAGCHGRRVVLVPDDDRISDEVAKAIEARLFDHASHLAECEAERRAGC
jgi:hypothetical protein